MIRSALQNCISRVTREGWHKYYLAFDIVGTILQNVTDKRKILSAEFFPYAKEALVLLSRQDDVTLIVFTSSLPQRVANYMEFFEGHRIHFDYVNNNPEVPTNAYEQYDRKFYFHFLFDNKAGFEPSTDWKDVHELFAQFYK